MKVLAISDIHGFYPKLPSGDLLIVAGDLTGNDSASQWQQFYKWFDEQNYKKKIYIGGNHDNFLVDLCNSSECGQKGKEEHLRDSGTEYKGIKIWGMPWNIAFEGQNPRAASFSINEEEMDEKCALIPLDTQILITHSPPYGILDGSRNIIRFGSKALLEKVKQLPNLKYHFFGHIHEGYGIVNINGVHYVNCAHADRWYEPENAPIKLNINNETLELIKLEKARIRHG